MAAPAPAPSEAHACVAEALTRLRDDLERMSRRRFPSLDAGDVYQRASLRALEGSAALRDPARVDGWVRRIVVRIALDLLRARRTEIELSEGDEPEAPPVDEGGACACTLALLEGLPPSYQDILRRVDVEGAGLSEVAQALAISPGNAAVRLHRARRALRDHLRGHCGVETMRECLTCACHERGCCGTA